MSLLEYESDEEDPLILKPYSARHANRRRLSPSATRNDTYSSHAPPSDVVEDSDEDVTITYVRASKEDYEMGCRREPSLSSPPSPLQPSFRYVSPELAPRSEAGTHFASSCHTQQPHTPSGLPSVNDLTIMEVEDNSDPSETSFGPTPLGNQDVQSHGRSLRKRNAKQIHPYRFENKLYVQQMQKGGQADAIVKLRDIHRVSSLEDEREEFREVQPRLETPFIEDGSRSSLSPYRRRENHDRDLHGRSNYLSTRVRESPYPSGGGRLFLRPSTVTQSSLRRKTPEEHGKPTAGTQWIC